MGSGHGAETAVSSAPRVHYLAAGGALRGWQVVLYQFAAGTRTSRSFAPYLATGHYRRSFVGEGSRLVRGLRSPVQSPTGMEMKIVSAKTLDGLTQRSRHTFINSSPIRGRICLWTPAEGAEIFRCLIYNNGWQDRQGHGHGIYTQNRAGQKHSEIASSSTSSGWGYMPTARRKRSCRISWLITTWSSTTE
jgi:hypothetical protein